MNLILILTLLRYSVKTILKQLSLNLRQLCKRDGPFHLRKGLIEGQMSNNI